MSVRDHVHGIYAYLHATWRVIFMDPLPHQPEQAQFAPVLYDIWRLQRSGKGEIVDAWVGIHISTVPLIITLTVVGVGVCVCACARSRARVCTRKGCVRILHNKFLRCIAAPC